MPFECYPVCYPVQREHFYLPDSLDLDFHENEKELLLFAQQRCLGDEHPLEALSAKETEERIRKIADSLPERCRQVFERYFYYGESTEAISERMHISQSTVRVQLKTALDRLRTELGIAVLFAYIFGSIVN